jgi:hypothetical protein
MENSNRKYQKHKTSVKVTVKHQVNTYINPGNDESEEPPLHPIYVTVSVNRQFTRFKSRMRRFVSLREFESELNLPQNKSFAENERLIIEEGIKLFNPEDKANFKLTEWSRYYESGLIEVSKCIDLIFNRKISKILQYEYGFELEEFEALPGDVNSTLSVMSILGIGEADKLIEDYSPLLKLRVYESVLRLKYHHNHTYCFWDLKSGYYQDQLLLLLGDEAKPAINKLDQMVEEVIDDEGYMYHLNLLSLKNIPE